MIIYPFTNTGRAVKCWAPCHLGGGRSASGDIELHWYRRAIFNGAWIGGADVPLGEPVERYKLIVYEDDTFAVVKITTYVDDATTRLLTAAEQTAAFGGTLGAGDCSFGVAQLGALGYGYEGRATL